MNETEQLQSLIIHIAQKLWTDKYALHKFLEVVARNDAFTELADALQRANTPPTTAAFLSRQRKSPA
ncbi:hypothetical protein [Streptomyces sp. Ac-502]|uniref:hypothetical protein n=1 Tax=Streptomyces sp. Ac-502 TaxID=3342801 RepID=UPI0038629F3F